MTVAIVAGALANKPGNGGEAWVRLTWALGLRRLGFDAHLVEWIAREDCRNGCGVTVAPERSVNARWFASVTERFGLAGGASLLAGGASVIGRTPSELADLCDEAAVLVNISGHLRDRALLGRPRVRVYVDVDPGYTQAWHASGIDMGLEDHDAHFTVGSNVGTDRSAIPGGGMQWQAIRPPVLLERWTPDGAPRAPARYTTVASLRGAYGRLEYDGKLLGQRVHELRSVTGLPARVPETVLEIALAADPADRADTQALEEAGWRLVDPLAVAGDPLAFRDYVAGSWGELAVAQSAYVTTNSGWFSDRSAHYLAAGRPVVLQDTGFAPSYPVGDGLIAFRTPDEAVEALRRVTAEPEAHREAARAIAEEFLDSDAVLAGVLERAGVP